MTRFALVGLYIRRITHAAPDWAVGDAFDGDERRLLYARPAQQVSSAVLVPAKLECICVSKSFGVYLFVLGLFYPCCSLFMRFKVSVKTAQEGN